MNEMPETLRELASEISNPGHKIRARMDAHVAIWEAEQTELLRFRAGASKLQDHIEAIEADRDALREAYALLWTFDLEPKFDARGTYSERKSNEWKTLLDKAQGICPRPLASLPPEETGGAKDGTSPNKGGE